ncbi:gp8 [Listeria phage P40]|uniref:head-tail adaptor n=1 Tax=Listeria phage P40 TaxID=560178 RepID=UPI00018198BF|nr:head-tail adaptor [Listeria phage P40]ACI00368.1 gp8 [Listeria phage P40]
MIKGIKDFQVYTTNVPQPDGKGGSLDTRTKIFEGRAYIDFQSDTDSMTKANMLYPDATHIMIYIKRYSGNKEFVGSIGDTLICNGVEYFVNYIDDVMDIQHHLEIMLREKPTINR